MMILGDGPLVGVYELFVLGGSLDDSGSGVGFSCVFAFSTLGGGEVIW